MITILLPFSPSQQLNKSLPSYFQLLPPLHTSLLKLPLYTLTTQSFSLVGRQDLPSRSPPFTPSVPPVIGHHVLATSSTGEMESHGEFWNEAQALFLALIRHDLYPRPSICPLTFVHSVNVKYVDLDYLVAGLRQKRRKISEQACIPPQPPCSGRTLRQIVAQNPFVVEIKGEISFICNPIELLD